MNEQYPEYIESTVELPVAIGQSSERLDIYITNAIAHATRNKVQIAIDNGSVTVNGDIKKTSYKIKPGDSIICRFLRPPQLELVPEDIPLEVVYEDDDILVIIKPSGLVVHPGFGNRYGTLVNAVLWHTGIREPIPLLADQQDDADPFEQEINIEEILTRSSIIRPGIVHRLDKDTSGLMVISKKPEWTHVLSKQFADRTVQREYIAIAWGKVKADHDIIETFIAPSPRNRKVFAVSKRDGKLAKTEYWTISRGEYASLLRLKLHTGRTHQIRVHCSNMHHPLIGDISYGGDKIAYTGMMNSFNKSTAHRILQLMPHQALHARVLGFTHPRTGENLLFTSLPDQNFLQAMELACLEFPESFL